MIELDGIISNSLKAFLAYINQTNWTGRENEAVSLYAFGFLQKECSQEGPLYDPMQIGIEVGAADTPKGPNSQVRKDLVIWKAPGENRWNPTYQESEPLAIMEWKVWRPETKRHPSTSADISWLSQHCGKHPETVGYSIFLDLTDHPAKLTLIRVDSTGHSESLIMR
jgi:hypothetical protein